MNIRVTSITEAHDRVITAQDGVFCEVELHLGHIPEQHYVAMTPSSDGTQTEIKRNREEMKVIDRRKGAAKEPTVMAPKLDMSNRFWVLGASADEDETASLEDLKDTPKAPTSATTITFEDYASFYPNLDRVLVEAIVSSHEAPGDIIEKLDEMWAEAEFQRQDAEETAASLVGLEDKPKATTCAATVEKMVSSLEAMIELQEPKLLDIEDKPKAPTCVS